MSRLSYAPLAAGPTPLATSGLCASPAVAGRTGGNGAEHSFRADALTETLMQAGAIADMDQAMERAVLRRGEVDSGTSIIAVEFDGGVVIGADSRTSTGIYVANRVSDKLTEVHERIYCCRSGSAADTQAVSDMVRMHLDAAQVTHGMKRPLVKTAAQLFRKICYDNKDRLMAGIICAGWDEHKGGQVYAVTLGGTTVRQAYTIGGSGSTYIYGFCDRMFKPGMSKDECVTFVRRALAHAMARDGSSGGVIRTVCITKDGVDRTFTAGNTLPYHAEGDVQIVDKEAGLN